MGQCDSVFMSARAETHDLAGPGQYVNKKEIIKMELKVKVENVYGQKLVYPACKLSRSFAALTQCKTLTRDAISEIKTMGYTFTVEAPELD
tara:strand:- start:131 stop:403 length:273 start_codon:yes stop_codon:yes gene_type:complete